jgi:hypothetical protein
VAATADLATAAVEAGLQVAVVDLVIEVIEEAAGLRAVVGRAVAGLRVAGSAVVAVVPPVEAPAVGAAAGAVLTPVRCSADWTPTATVFSIQANSRGQHLF